MFLIPTGCDGGSGDDGDKPPYVDFEDTGGGAHTDDSDTPSSASGPSGAGILHGGALALLPPIAFKIAYRQSEKDRRGFNTAANIDTCIPVLEGGTDCSDYSPPDPLPSTDRLVGLIQKDLCQSSDFLAYVQAYIDDSREWDLPGGGGGFKSAPEPGEIGGMPAAEFLAMLEQRFEGDAQACAFDQVSAASEGELGGITYTVTVSEELDEEDFCILADPETTSWTPDQSAYPNNASDDGDVELMVGPSSVYTGIVGEKIGSFPGIADGVQLSNRNLVGGPERITLSGNATISDYTILVRPIDIPFDTINGMPFDDEELSTATVVLGERCTRIDTSEILLLGESLNSDGSVRDCTRMLEVASVYSGTTLTAFCCANPDMCGPIDSTSEICTDIFAEASGDSSGGSPFGNSSSSDRNEWCFETGLCCDFGDDWTPYSSRHAASEWEGPEQLISSTGLIR